MNFVLSAKPEYGYLLIKAAGRIFGIDEYKHLTDRAVAEITGHGIKKIVFDASLITWLHSFRLQSDIVDYYTVALPEEIRLSKIACLVDEEAIGMLKFWEFIANRKGFNVKAFCSKSLAVHWVKGPD